jgi:O-antigen/teichoic acid export membrane protein
MASLTQTTGSGALGPRLRRLPGLAVAGNLGSRIVAMAALGVVTVIVARAGGPSDVGVLALLRVLPGLAGVLAACGLPSAMGYFIAGPERDHPHLWPTVIAVMFAGALVGMLGWFALAPLIHRYFISSTSLAVVAVAGVTVATQLPVAVAKGCLQALEDLRGCNVVIAAEEAAFLPAYLAGHLLGLRGPWLIVAALIAADLLVAVGAWMRIARRVHHSGVRLSGRADRGLSGRVVRFGLRSQVGGTVGLLNLRFDFLVLGAMAGPAAVGIYAVASKYAELLRLPALALTWVTYPRVARMGASTFGPRARALMAPLLAAGLGLAAALVLLVFPLFPWLYGVQFRAAILPAVIILFGLVAEPAAGVGSAFLLGTGRPGLNSLLLGAGLVVTLVLDVVLIPSHAAVGAAWASALAYLLTDILLVVVMWRMTRTRL